MNKKTKKVVTIMSVCLAILIIIAVILAVSGKKNNSDSPKNEIETQTGTNQSELEVVEEKPEQVENPITEKAEATYEEWLAAAMVVGISLQYPEYEFSEIYVTSNKEAYVTFMCGGEEVVIHSKALEKERTEAGTKDLYTKDLGFATFDEISAENIDSENYKLVEMEELSELINQSVLVSVYER